jgi:DNA polymerase
VYCASVDSSYILIRGNGKIAVTGQCQNFARPALPKGEIQIALDVLGRGDHAAALALWGDRTMDAAVSCLRGVLKAPPGFEFIDADYSSVENRVGVWLAGQDDKLEMFRQGLDEYRQFSSTSLHKVPYDQVTGDMRQMSKSAVLGCLFGQGWRGLISYSAGYGVALTDERSQEVVKLYRAEYRKVRDLWYRCGDASIGAVRAPGAWFKAGDKLALICHKNFLWLKLPSGRLIAWSRPRVEMREAPWMEKFIAGYDDDGDEIIGERPAMREVVTVESIETKTRQYVRHPLIGSSIFQSGVQGTAADILGEGLLNVEAAGYSVRMLTHDELTALVPAGRGDPDEFGRLMCLPAPWREDLPLAYEAWQSGRFRK